MLVDRIMDLMLFTHIVKERSLSSAARETGLSSAAVTKRLQHLEEQLGVRLINRSTRKLSVTEEGAQYYDYCVRILAQIEEAESVITQHSCNPKGTLRVTVPTHFGHKYITPLIPKFMIRHPHLHLSLDMSDSMADIIDDGYDLAVRIGNMKDCNLVATRLGVERRVAVATPHYLASYGEPKTPADLASHNVLLYANPTPQALWTFTDQFGDAHAVKVAGNFETNSCKSLKKAVLAGLGIALRPAWDVSEDIEAGTLKVVLPHYVPPSFNIQAVYPSGRHLSQKVKSFIELLQESFREASPMQYPESMAEPAGNPTLGH